MKIMRAIVFLFFATLPSFALANMVKIATDSYIGLYWLDRDAGSIASGPRTVNLTPGDHSINIAPGVGFNFTVNNDGTIQSLSPTTQVDNATTPPTLIIQTAMVEIVRGGYPGTYSIRNVNYSSEIGNVRTYDLPIGVDGYILDFAPSNNFRFNVATNGLPEPVTASAELFGNQLRLLTTSVRVDPGSLSTGWMIRGAEPVPTPGIRSVTLTRDSEGHILSLAPGVGIRFDVSPNGSVFPQKPGQAKPFGNRVSLATRPIKIIPVAHNRKYWIIGAESRTNSAVGERVVEFVPDAGRYSIALSPGNSAFFEVDEDGAPSKRTVTVSENGVDYLFTLQRQTANDIFCRLNAEFTLTQKHRLLPTGAKLQFKAEVLGSLKSVYDNGNISHYEWTGLATIKDPIGGVLKFTRGRYELTYKAANSGNDALVFQLSNGSGIFAGRYIRNTGQVNIQLLGDNAILVNGDFVSDLSVWDALKTTRIVQNLDSAAISVHDLDVNNSSCF